MTSTAYVLSAPVSLDHPGHFLHWGVLQISAGNAVLVLVMLVLFALALLLPFPKGREER